jgi:hypothetical protein
MPGAGSLPSRRAQKDNVAEPLALVERGMLVGQG